MSCEFQSESSVCDVVFDCAKSSVIRPKQVDQVVLQGPYVLHVYENNLKSFTKWNQSCATRILLGKMIKILHGVMW